MLFWLFIILLAGSIGMIIWYQKTGGWDDEWKLFTGVLGCIIVGIAIVISLFIIGDAYGCKDARIASNKVRYDSLVYQLENDIYDNDNDLGKRELYKEIQDWNEDLAYNRKIQKNFWIGIYYANIYDQFEFIELK
jgi:hypothetical protein